MTCMLKRDLALALGNGANVKFFNYDYLFIYLFTLLKMKLFSLTFDAFLRMNSVGLLYT